MQSVSSSRYTLLSNHLHLVLRSRPDVAQQLSDTLIWCGEKQKKNSVTFAYNPPQAVKRRPKPLRLLTMPREEARELLFRGVDPYEKQRHPGRNRRL